MHPLKELNNFYPWFNLCTDGGEKELGCKVRHYHWYSILFKFTFSTDRLKSTQNQ